MYDAGLQLFWYRPLFMIELLVSVLLFTLNLRKKEHFALRAGLCIAVLLALAFAVPIVYQNAAWGSVLFLSMLVAVIFAMKVCFAESWWNVLFCGIAAYSVRHIAYTVFISINQLFFSLTNAALEVDPYNKPIMAVPGRYMFIIVSIYLVCYFVVYWIGYFLYAGRIRRSEDLNLGYSRIVLFSGAIILIDIVLSLVTEYNAQIDVTSLVVERPAELEYETESNTFDQRLRAAVKNNTFMYLSAQYANSVYNASDDVVPIIQGTKTEVFPWWIPILVVLDVIVVAGCGTWLFFTFRKKKEQAA